MPPAPGVDPLSILSRLETLGIRLGLEKTRELLAALGDPQKSFPAVLIAGTNGKGSTSALLASMVQAAGYRTGLYTSPHLERVEERLRIDGQAIEPGRLGALLERIVGLAERVQGTPPTYFEAITVAAFLAFAEARVDLAVLEVGMGGRLDATNLSEPVLSVITPIGFDHQEFLGNTLAAIAREKAGILRPGRPALVWIEDEEPAAAVRESAALVGARLAFAQDEVAIESIEPLGWEGQAIRLKTPVRRYDLRLALVGDHQAKNLGLAVRAAEILEIGPEAIAAGAAACRWPGRIESVDLPDGRRVVLDAAHNESGAAVLAAFLSRMGEPVDFLFGVLADKDYARMIDLLAAFLSRMGEPVDFLFGVLTDKDYARMIELLAPHGQRWVLTTPQSSRAKDPAELAELLPGREIVIEPDPENALDRALALGGRTLVACGSIYLIGEIRKGLRERLGVPPPL